MRGLLPIIIIMAAAGFMTVNALNVGQQIASDGMAALNAKYVGRCLSLTDGRSGSILAVRGRTIRVVDSADEYGEVLEIERVPELDRYLVKCPQH